MQDRIAREIDYKGKKISPSLTLFPSPVCSAVLKNARKRERLYGYTSFSFLFRYRLCFLKRDILYALLPSLKIYG